MLSYTQSRPLKRRAGGFTSAYRRPTAGRSVRRRRAGPRSIAPAARGYQRVAGFYGRYSNGGELKFHDVDLDDATVAATGTITPTIIIIPQGVTENTRVGRKCTIKSIMWHYDIVLGAGTASSTTSDIVRMILYLDKQTNGATATALNILQTDDYQSFNNLSNSGRFVKLMDKSIALASMSGSGRGSTDTLAFGENVRTGAFYKKCSIPIEYDDSASTGALTTIRTNNLGVLLISKSGVCGFTSKFRMRFSDS